MLPFPNPLHPAVVHFPIAMLLVGSAAAVVAVFFRRWHLPWLAALLLVIGAAGSVVAVGTGEQEEEMAETSSAAAEQVLDEHEEWGKRTRNLALAAAVISVAAALVSRFKVAGIGLSTLAALLALASAYAVVRAGHFGGELVYRHGVGVNSAAGTAVPDAANPRGDDDND